MTVTPEQLQTQPTQATTPAPEATQTASVTQTQTPSTTPSGPVESGTQAQQTQQTQQTQAQQQAVLAALRGYGVEIPSGVSDDQQALQYLANIYRQSRDAQQLAGYGREYMQHAEQFRAWMAQQQQAARQQQEQSRQWWKAPEYDPSWQSKLYRDPQTGELRTLPGADPAIATKFAAWVEHQRNFLDKFSQDPIGAIAPGIQQIAEEIALKAVQQHLGNYREQTVAQQLVAQNSEWMHERDQNGQVLLDQSTGRPMLSEWGRRYGQYVMHAERAGLGSVHDQHNYAMSMVQRDAALYRLSQQSQQQAGQAAGQQAKEQFLNNATRQPNVAANGTHGANGAATSPSISNPSALKQAMMANLQAAGYAPGQPVDGGP